MEERAILSYIVLAAVLMVTAKLLLRGEPNVDFEHVLGLVVASMALLIIGAELSQSIQEGLLSILLVLLVVTIIVFFTSDVMYEWGKLKSAIFAAVFALAFIGLEVLSFFLKRSLEG